jgi:cytoskeletal protein CcmA (bactofilin family)
MFFNRQKSSSQGGGASSPEPSYVARDTSFEGNVICDGEIHIDGAIRGTVRAQTCLVDAHGEVHGEIVAQHVFVRGRVMGPITGTHVTISAGAHVEGNITHETISIENGAYVFGSMRQGGMAPNQMQNQAAPMNQAISHDPFFKVEDAIAPDDNINNVRPLKAVKP